MTQIDHPLLAFVPYPTVMPNGELRNGVIMAQPQYCIKKCPKHVCASANASTDGSITYSTCPHGFSVAAIQFDAFQMRINGVVETTSSTAPPKFKKANKGQKLRPPELQHWVSSLHRTLPAYEEALESKAVDSIHAFHDIKAIIGTILQTAEQWIFDHEGASVDDKVSNAPEPLVTIYHGCRVLESLLLMTDVLSNPDSATFGKPIATSVHGVFFLLRKVFEARARKRGVGLDLIGPSYNRPALYKSFIVVPLILVDNAVKYANPGTSVRLTVEDYGDSIDVDVASYGKLIPHDAELRIFEKGGRGPNATVRGTGLGLHIAQIVATANGFAIRYRGEPASSPSSGWNHFHFRIPARAPEPE